MYLGVKRETGKLETLHCGALATSYISTLLSTPASTEGMTRSVFILWGLKIRFEEHGLPALAQGIAMNRAEHTSLHSAWKSLGDTCVRQTPPLVPRIIRLET